MTEPNLPYRVLDQLPVPYQDCVQRVYRLYGEDAAYYLAEMMIHKRSDRKLTEKQLSGIGGQEGFRESLMDRFNDPVLRGIGS